VAIINTTLQTVGRPAELRDRLFNKGLVVRTTKPLEHPDKLFAGLAGVESWRAGDDGEYALTVTDPSAVAPELTRALVSAGADVLSIGESRHSLEDVYLELIADDVEAERR
jgi:ABC-2 type transport system ATP-binding protein